ncbi:MAG: hypothetical protein ACLQOO_23735 [Terriglobia bacterium]
MKHRKSNLLVATAAALLTVGLAQGHVTRETHPPFSYAGGTEALPENCGGQLEVSQDQLVFRCGQHPITIPLASITLMQYRPDVSRRVLKLKLQWKVEVRPVEDGKPKPKNQNRYFTIVYAENGAPHAVVLEVEPPDMRPYLAEIEMKSGRRVQVMGYEPYGY